MSISFRPYSGRAQAVGGDASLIITTAGLKSTAVSLPADTLLIGETGQHTRYDQAYLRHTRLAATFTIVRSAITATAATPHSWTVM